MRPPALRASLACPLCRGPLADGDGAALSCGGCGRPVLALEGGRHDFRLRPGESIHYERRYSPADWTRAQAVTLQTERASEPPRNAFADGVPTHLTPAQVSWLPTAQPGDIALDLGCGRGEQRGVLEGLGYACYAVDFEGSAADDLVDAHALPLADASIDLVMSIAVLEHLADPVRATAEVARVLKPGSPFVGTVAFLEPFHDASFFHHSHLGVALALQTSGFTVGVVSPIPSWDALRAQIEMEVGSGGRPTRLLAGALSAPFVWALEAYGALGRRLARGRGRYERPLLRARHAGAFFFAARKADEPRVGAEPATRT
jgi:SAM-dependent methyltransferase